MSQAKARPEGRWIIVTGPTSLPPKDGNFVEAKVTHKVETIALQFDPKIGRWFNGKGHAVKERDIISWFEPKALTAGNVL